jgi:hypothetical protein
VRAYQVFASMTPERSTDIMRVLREKAPAMFHNSVAIAAASFKMRPVYLKAQPLEKRADVVRRALARVTTNAIAEEMLAVYFLECRKPLLIEWLDTLGIKHEEGTLADDAPAEPDAAVLRAAVEKFRSAGDDADRELLLQAFAAQSAIEWPALEALLKR